MAKTKKSLIEFLVSGEVTWTTRSGHETRRSVSKGDRLTLRAERVGDDWRLWDGNAYIDMPPQNIAFVEEADVKARMLGTAEATDPKSDCVRSLMAMFTEVPDGFQYNGQTFEERCEAWIMHAIDELERELEEFGTEDEDDVEMTWRNFYKCPRCGHEWDDTWDSQCDDDCPECGARHISPYESEETGQ